MIDWLKRNWLVVILLLLIVGNYLSKNILGIRNLDFISGPASYESSYDTIMSQSAAGGLSSLGSLGNRSSQNMAPPTDNPNRLVIQDTSLSLVVKDVPRTIKDIESKTSSLGGFLINSNLNRPEQSASGTISVRIPHDRIAEALEAFKGFSVKVVSENVYGRDVTDQYEDLGAKLEILNKTKAKYEAILENAVAVSDLLNVQRELVSLQSQIDSLKGQQEFYKQSSNLSRINIYLSTDELSLPYTPDNSWRPAVVFKTAIRSLLGTFRSLGSAVIWLFVFSPVWIPVAALIWLLKKRKNT